MAISAKDGTNGLSMDRAAPIGNSADAHGRAALHTKNMVGVFDTVANTRPSIGLTSTAVLAANTERRYLKITNLSGGTVWIMLGAAGVASQGIELLDKASFEMKSDGVYTGAINGIAITAPKVVEVVEGTLA